MFKANGTSACACGPCQRLAPARLSRESLHVSWDAFSATANVCVAATRASAEAAETLTSHADGASSLDEEATGLPGRERAARSKSRDRSVQKRRRTPCLDLPAAGTGEAEPRAGHGGDVPPKWLHPRPFCAILRVTCCPFAQRRCLVFPPINQADLVYGHATLTTPALADL